MPSQSQNYQLKLYDIWGTADGQEKIGQALDDMFGTKVNSNANVIDSALGSHDRQIDGLNTKVSEIITNEFKVFLVNLTLNSFTDTSTSYVGNTADFNEYKNGYIYLFKFSEPNVGAVQFNINNIGYFSLKKFKNGYVSDLETNDLRQGVGYLVYYKNSQFELIGENFNTEMKQYDPTFKLATIEHNLNKYPMCELYKTTWAAGIGGAGEGPVGGTSLIRIGSNTIQIPGSVEHIDKNSVAVYSTQEYQEYTNISKISDTEYCLLAPDTDVTHQSLVLLLF